MAKSIKVQQKRPGRPATGKDPLLTVRAPQEVIDAVDAWAAKNGAKRSAAVRRLLLLGLKAKPK
jgi:ribbon-helix-helix CopG family protein